jgi:hypothetical protein|tara:strand:+ start:291 stop:512 length:222 start_codon:yes stop_codon:yes gene_type:complete
MSAAEYISDNMVQMLPQLVPDDEVRKEIYELIMGVVVNDDYEWWNWAKKSHDPVWIDLIQHYCELNDIEPDDF